LENVRRLKKMRRGKSWEEKEGREDEGRGGWVLGVEEVT
jgi:hypothetical protein